jgi:hypothetical protein
MEAKSRDCISIMTSLSKTAEKSLIPPAAPPEMDIVGFLVIGIVSGDYVNMLIGS